MFCHRPRSFSSVLAALVSAMFCGGVPASASAKAFNVLPEKVQLDGNFSQTQLLVTSTLDPSHGADHAVDRLADLTHQVEYSSSDAGVVSVDPSGRLLAKGNGNATITIRMKAAPTKDGASPGNASQPAAGVILGGPETIDVEVKGVLVEPQIGFTYHIGPVMNKAGCNAAACHASQHGKGGFKLSVFGYAPDEDYAAIVRDQLGRRVDLVDPDQSLVLLKPTATIPHGGGRRLMPGSVDYEIIRSWLAGGAPPPKPTDPKAASMRVYPAHRTATQDVEQQLRVEVTYTDGRTRDVTAWTKFDSMDDAIVSVTPEGLCRTVGRRPGGGHGAIRRPGGNLPVRRPLFGQDRSNRLEQQQLRRRTGRPEVHRVGHQPFAVVRRRNLPAAGFSRRDRHGSDGRRVQGLSRFASPRQAQQADRSAAWV